MAAPATQRPADFFALTKILIVPSVGRESFGRVSAEALINGIPPLVSDRGGLPQTMRGAGRIIPLPAWMTEKTTALPTIEETQPWFDAICELRDNEDAYLPARRNSLGLLLKCWHSERVMRQRYLDYFASVRTRRPTVRR